MPQFTVYRNANTATKAAVPYLLDVQNGLLEDLGTRVVIPLMPTSTLKGKTLRTLTPIFEIEGKSCVLMTPQLAGVSRQVLGGSVTDLSARRDEIVAALDLLVTGI